MTRETKIGLLVGLAFIIVIGILLSDHMATTTEPTAAALDTAALRAREAIVVPGAESRGATVPAAITPGEVQPQAQVPTQTELTHRPRPVSEIVIGGGVTPGPAPSNGEQTVINTALPGNVINPGNTLTPGGVDPNLAAVARQQGVELVQPGQRDSGAPQPPTQRAGSASKVYTVESGDNLSKIARKTMGADTKANRDAIVKANPSLAANPSLIQIGQELTIPAGPAAQQPAHAQASSTRVLPLPQPAPSNARSERSDQSYTYTVKSGDNLYRIASEHLGTPSAVAAIKDLNRDVLKGGDMLRVGMRLKLPAKPVARAD